MIFAFIDEERGNHTVSILCKVLGVTRAGYYARKSRPASDHDLQDAELAQHILDVHAWPAPIFCTNQNVSF